jgi:hypothetical protein
LLCLSSIASAEEDALSTDDKFNCVYSIFLIKIPGFNQAKPITQGSHDAMMPDAQSQERLAECEVEALDGQTQPRCRKDDGVFVFDHI